jgi:hypothetical protein
MMTPTYVTTTVNAKGPLRTFATLEQRLGQSHLMWWLQTQVSPFMGDVIVDRFAYGGDASVGGPWPPLAAYTEKLKRSIGAPANAPNERTGDLMYHLAYEHSVEPWIGGALLRVPGRSDALEEKKIRTLQEGEAAGANPFGGATPPRPVLGIGEYEEVGIQRLFDNYLWDRL